MVITLGLAGFAKNGKLRATHKLKPINVVAEEQEKGVSHDHSEAA